MADFPSCPSCGKLGVGDQCAHCGAKMKRAAAPAGEMASVSVPGLQVDAAEIAGKRTSALEDPRHRKAAAYLALQPSEMAVLDAASRIFAGFAASGAVTEENEAAVSDRAVRVATRMALVIEKYIQSDNEDW